MTEELLPPCPATDSLSSEFRLLAACSWIAPSPHDKSQKETICELIRKGIDWDQFLILVKRHGVISQSYASLSRSADEQLPQKVLQALKRQRLPAVARAMLQESELCRLNRLCADQGFAMMPLKGVLLSYRLYGDAKLRSSSDIDLLVQQNDLSNADQLLQREGYTCNLSTEPLTQRQWQFITDGTHHLEYDNDKTGLHIELHWQGSFWTPEQTALLWQRSCLIKWSGQNFCCLDQHAELLYLCEHGASHKWYRLKWISDIAMLLTMEHKEGWRDTINLAEQLGLKRILAQSALLVWWLYAIPVPGEIARIIKEDKIAVALAEEALQSIMMTEAEISRQNARRLEKARRAWDYWRLKPSLSYWMIVKNISNCPSDMQCLHLPDRFFWAYIPLRPFFWILRKLRLIRT